MDKSLTEVDENIESGRKLMKQSRPESIESIKKKQSEGNLEKKK